MYIIVGLGNPGSEYERTRHNTGRRIVNRLAKKAGITLKEKKKPDHKAGTGDMFGKRVRIVLPDTFMNNSGRAVAPYVKSVAAAKRLVVVQDEIDLPLGTVKVSFGSSAAGHNGVKSVERAVKTKRFIRIRVGVARPTKKKGSVIAKKPVGDKAVVDYLLGRFTEKEAGAIEGTAYERAEGALAAIFKTDDPVAGMNAVNGLPAKPL